MMTRIALFLTAVVLAADPARAQQTSDAPTFETSGVVRARGEVYTGRPFGSSGPGDDDYVLWRGLADAELRSGEDWAAHLQLGWHDQSGRARGPAPTDVGELDIRQAYVDLRAGDGARLRLGRQELMLGSARLVAARDGPNLRRAFDGARLTARYGAWTGEAFVFRPVQDWPGAFDDRSDRDQLFGGLYLTRKAAKASLDLYYLNLEREAARFGAVTAREQRHTVGLRAFGRSTAWDYNVEAVTQWGRFGDGDIRAWTLASDVGLTLTDKPLRPRLALKANVTSGDRDATDDRLGTFNPLFPNLAYFNEAALLAPQNHIDLHPYASVTLNSTLEASVGVDWFWKTARADDIYRGPGVPVGARKGPRRVGRQIDLNLRWRPSETMEIRAGYVRFNVGTALRRVGGENTDFSMLSLQTRF